MEQRILIYAPGGQDAALAAKVLASEDIACHACRSADDLAEQLALGAGCSARSSAERQAWQAMPSLVSTLVAKAASWPPGV